MTRVSTPLAALLSSLALLTPPASAAPARRAAAPACCQVAAGTLVQVEVVNGVDTKTQKTGDTFPIRLTAPLIVDGRIVLRAGTPGQGEVIEATKPGMGGRPAKLVLAARYLDQAGTHVALQGLQLTGVGQGHVGVANAIGVTGLALGPVGLVGFAIKGGDAVIPPGTKGTAKLVDAVTLPSVGKASRAAIAAAARAVRASDAADHVPGAVPIPTPPAGQGQVVFFRAKSVMGTGQWFNVREDGKALGKLTNGAYFIQPAAPGLHTYTAKTEPEFNNSLRLQVDPGETYFVEGLLAHGVIIGAADLAPSDRAAFDKVSGKLALAPPVSEEKPEERADPQPASDTAPSSGPVRP